MNPERYQRVKQVFAAAVECDTGTRALFVAEACAGDAELQSQVESLLEHDSPAAAFIEESAFEVTARLLADEEDRATKERHIGPYKILEEIGRGGMGVVYLAVRDDDEYRKQVAIKLIKRGMDTDAVLRRFRHERQILANLEHPNIARLLDGGTNADGLPYFVMEYVEGQSIDLFCESRGLPLDKRLKIFRQVCTAVTYAHQNLVIHRDLKPSNILVTQAGEVRLLDFGVAKFLDPTLTEAGVTETRFRVMTPEFASPEQVRGQHVTTATDIYSLGVILYELLTGARPYKLKETSPAELARVICESVPTRPSESGGRLRVLRRATDTGHRSGVQSEIRNLKLLKGDLDAIVLKALRKEPEWRYTSVSELSEDIGRHLAGLPIRARVGGFSYRANRFIRRNRLAVAAASLVLLTLLGGIVATTWQARKAREQARLANAKSAEVQTALAKTEKLNRFMQSMFSYANPDWFGRAGGRRDMSVLEAMRDIEKHIDEDFRDEPDLRADVYQQIGDAYRTQGLSDDAERNLRAALRLRQEIYGEDNAKVAESMYILSGVRLLRGDYAEQELLLTKALSIQRRHPDEGNNLPYMLLDYASLLTASKNDYAGALALEREALAEFHRRYGESHLMIGLTQSELVKSYTNLGDYAQAETTGSIARERFKQQPLVLWSIVESDAHIKTIRGDYPAAADAIKQMLAHAQSKDAKPIMMAAVHYAQSLLAYRQGDYARAKVYAEKALATAQASGFADYSTMHLLAPSLNKLGQAKRAESLLLREIERVKQSERVFDLAKLKSLLGENLTAQRRFWEAETVLMEAYEVQKSRVLPQQDDLLETRKRLTVLYRAQGKTLPSL